MELLDFLIDLFLHHLKQILVLDLQLVHDPSEALLELIDLFVELLSDLHLQLVIEFLVNRDGLVMLLDLNDHLLDHFFHFLNLGRDLNNIMLHFGVLKDALRAEH